MHYLTEQQLQHSGLKTGEARLYSSLQVVEIWIL